jgi:hypothetical protein
MQFFTLKEERNLHTFESTKENISFQVRRIKREMEDDTKRKFQFVDSSSCCQSN